MNKLWNLALSCGMVYAAYKISAILVPVVLQMLSQDSISTAARSVMGLFALIIFLGCWLYLIVKIFDQLNIDVFTS